MSILIVVSLSVGRTILTMRFSSGRTESFQAEALTGRLLT